MPRRISVLRRAGLAVLLLSALATHAAAPAGPPHSTPYPNTSGFGVDFDAGEDWHRQCMRVAHLAPRAAKTPASRPCAATDLYYLKRDGAATSPAEWRAVRQCALASGDDAVLMMLYANGYGLASDTDRAIYHACRLDTAKAEMEARVSHLASGAVALDKQPFDLCDHITSGRMGAVCAGLDETRADRVRTAHLERFAATLPARARAPFARLRKAAAAFARQSAGEIDMSGTAAAGVAIHFMGRRSDEFVEALEGAAQGKLERTSAVQFARLERALEARYRKVLALPSGQKAHPARIAYSTVTRADVRTTQRAWLAYRDAWGPYLAAAGKPGELVAIKARLTRQRIAQLSRF